jgi:oligopeptide/dipeptide ABC transporter ATP-binding protein
VLRRVRIPSPERRLADYPHQFSGGMRQRVCSAMAIACSPRLLLADEPTSNLDVTIQVQMMDLFRDIQRQTGVGIILITHDLGVAAGICHRIAVMYAGRVVETGDVRRIYRRPAHPYTRALLDSIPHLGQRRRRLYSIAGQPPSLIDPPDGCRFAPRCARVEARCRKAYPPEVEVSPGHRVACWLPLEAA